MRRLDLITLTLGAALLVLAVSCNDRPISAVEPSQTNQEQVEFPVNYNPNLDILFVIDDSGSMQAEQVSLAANFEVLINTLETLEGGIPNLHIGVVSTNMGAGASTCGGGDRLGDNGRLLSSPQVAGCSPPSGAYISNVEGERNYTGTLAETFSCIAQLGITGCGFEQPLAAMRKALDGSNPGNAGFLRPDARLAIIFITDEDDCSVHNTNMFDSADNPESPLGAYKSFRCFEFGVECAESDDPRTLGSRSECWPREGSSYLDDIDYFIDFVRRLKTYDSEIMVAGIVGTPTPITVVEDGDGDPCLFYSCGTATQCGRATDETGAVPPIRLKAFLDAFIEPQITTICNDDLSDAIQKIADSMVTRMNRCLPGKVSDLDPVTPGTQPECVVSETQGGEARPLGLCDNASDPAASTNLPCYVLREVEQCDTPTKLRVEVFYDEQDTVPPDTMIHTFCVSD